MYLTNTMLSRWHDLVKVEIQRTPWSIQSSQNILGCILCTKDIPLLVQPYVVFWLRFDTAINDDKVLKCASLTQAPYLTPLLNYTMYILYITPLPSKHVAYVWILRKWDSPKREWRALEASRARGNAAS